MVVLKTFLLDDEQLLKVIPGRVSIFVLGAKWAVSGLSGTRRAPAITY